MRIFPTVTVREWVVMALVSHIGALAIWPSPYGWIGFMTTGLALTMAVFPNPKTQ